MALGVICVFVIISGVFGLVYIQSISEKLNFVTTTTTPLVETIDDMIITMLEMNLVLEEISSTTNPEEKASLVKQFEAYDKNFKKTESITLNLIKDEKLKETFNKAIEQQRLLYENAQQIIAHQGNQQAVEELKIEANEHVDNVINTLEEVSIRAYTSNKNANTESFHAVRSTIIFLSLTTMLSLISALVMGIYLSRSFIRPIDALSNAASQLSAGNFEVTIDEPSSDDEISHLTLVFSKMVKSLQKLVKESPGLKKYIDLSVQKKQLPEPTYQLTEKSVYLIQDKTLHRAFDILTDKVSKGASALCITREEPDLVKDRYHLPDVEWVWLTENKDKRYQTTTSLQAIAKRMIEFISKKQSTIILLDRIDYLITLHGFTDVLKCIISLNDKVMTNNAILLIPLDPALLNSRHLSLLEKELKGLPSPTTQEKVPEELIHILSFIKNRKILKKLASFKDISKEFNITAPTTKKKLRELQEYGLIRIVKQGRNKLLEPTPQGERLT